MIFGQVEQAEKAFSETARTFGLAVAILITIVVVLSLLIWWGVRSGIKWLKPLIEKFFAMHVETMNKVQEGITDLLTSQKTAAGILKISTEAQMVKLEVLTGLTQATNTILVQGTKRQVEATEKVASAVKEAGNGKEG